MFKNTELLNKFHSLILLQAIRVIRRFMNPSSFDFDTFTSIDYRTYKGPT